MQHRSLIPLIQKNASIGAVDAYADLDYLRGCFVDAGWLGIARDCSDRRSIVLGRTGSGKSALLLELARVEANVIQIDPSDFAFRYVENSSIIQFFQAAGVNLDLFYRLLWRHVLVVELLRKRYKLEHQSDAHGLLEQIGQWVKFNPGRAAALEYLRHWGERFWEPTEVRAKELTTRFEDELRAGAQVDSALLNLGAHGATKLLDEQKEEIIHRGNEVVSSIQIRELRDIIVLLGERVFTNPRERCYVVIDKLDDNWAQDQTRYHLIKALIEEIRSFREIPNIKILVAIRQDLLLEVIDQTRNAGFQEEKYQDYYLDLRWARPDLVGLIDRRVVELYRRQGVILGDGCRDVLPPAKRGLPDPLQYIIQRTLMRPRDVIAFFNECLRLGAGRDRISWKTIRAAESSYSDRRLKAIQDEWRAHYPSIDHILELLRGLPSIFDRSDVHPDRIAGVIIECVQTKGNDACIHMAQKLVSPDNKLSNSNFLDEAFRILYKIGVVGIKVEINDPVSWSFLHEDGVTIGTIRRAIQFHVHKMMWNALGTRTVDGDVAILDEDDESYATGGNRGSGVPGDR
ncbi:MAG: P-loop ATPase, Sll1717 family [Rhodanobacteraceae bacterium]